MNSLQVWRDEDAIREVMDIDTEERGAAEDAMSWVEGWEVNASNRWLIGSSYCSVFVRIQIP